MTKRMSSSSIPPTRLEVVRYFTPPLHSSDLSVPGVVKAYGELPENAKINETDTFGDEEGEFGFEFGDEGELDIDDI